MYRFSKIDSQNSDSIPAIEKQSLSVKVGLFILSIFLFFRPITVSIHHIGSVSILDIFGLSISFLIFLGIIANISRIKLDLTSMLILYFIIYCLLSFLWGGTYRDITRTILPFLLFFLTKAIIINEKSANSLLWVLTLGYIVPVIGSILMISLGLSATMITGSMVERQAGLTSGVHTLAHLMLFLSFVFALYLLLEENKKFNKLVMFILFLGSLFCIYKTMTRTVILGGVFFWFSYLFFWKKKLFFLLLVLCMIGTIWKFDSLQKIITQEDAVSQYSHRQGFDINAATSGRIGIWRHNLQLYLELPFTTQLLGVGLGNELETLPGEANKKWMGSHNDYMSLLITTGIIGLSLYLIIYASLFFAFLLAPVSLHLRIFCITMLSSVLLMNFVSNSYIVRFQMAQLFWFLIGVLLAKFSMVRNRSIEIKNDTPLVSLINSASSSEGKSHAG